MCGISGIVSTLHELKRPLSILKMGASLQHRGPDHLGHYIAPAGNIIFSHRRLSLVGLDGRSTVITIPKRDNPQHQVALVFNGEIYNFRELKNFFATRGYISVSPSDFEVIIFAYQEWGQACVEHLHGEFAFVLYDEESAKMFMARDRTGVRPLYYAFVEGEFLFASEPKALLKQARELNQLDLRTTAEFLLMTHAFAAGSPSDSASFYANIKQFPPAHCAELKDGRLNLKRYWSLPFVDDVELPTASSRSLHDSLSESIKLRIPDELPVAVALSGGLDSSIVAAVLTQHKSSNQIEAFCVQYEGDSNPDFEFAEIVAKHLGIKLSGPVISPQNFMEGINRCIVANDGPVDSIRRMGMLANYEVMRSAGYKVALIGEGSDEFTLGYYHNFPGLKLDQELCSTAEALSSAFVGRANYIKTFFAPEVRQDLDLEHVAPQLETNIQEFL
jgi:asparagine synthase (glutamine-hydrolysing)